MEDLPLAVRAHSQGPISKPRSLSAFLWFLAAGVFSLGVVSLLLIGALRGIFSPQPIPGLNARLQADGRLLGHFPYPEARSTQLVEVSPGLMLQSDAAKSFLAMQRAAAADGIELSLLSAFRSIELQRKLFFDVKADRNQTASDRAKVSAPPGYSEHSTGFAVDIGDLRNPQTNLSRTFLQTQAYRWLRQNAARYQFVLSFPENNSQGVSFEPWHWRYEGSTEALKLFEPAQRLVRAKNSGASPLP